MIPIAIDPNTACLECRNDAEDMYYSEIKPLLQELEKREFKRNHIDKASMISEVMERFESVLKQRKEGGNE